MHIKGGIERERIRLGTVVVLWCNDGHVDIGQRPQCVIECLQARRIETVIVTQQNIHGEIVGAVSSVRHTSVQSLRIMGGLI